MSTQQPEDDKDADPSIANRFLAHQLSDAERVLLEAQLLVNPDSVRELEATARLKVGLHKLRESGELDALLRAPPRSYRTFAFAAAAVVVIGIALAFGRLQEQTEPLLVAAATQLADASGRPLPVSAPYVLIRNRAAVESTVLALPPSRQAITLRLFPSLQARAPYRVSVSGADGKAVGSIAIASADDDRFVTVFIDSARLGRGDYQITVADVAGTNAESYRFEVR